MGREFKFPDLGEGITEGELVRWLVQVGDEVQEDQEVAEVETDKALVTIPSPMSGKIEKLCFQEGDKIPVGEVLMVFAEEAGKTEAQPEAAAPENKTKTKAKPQPAAEATAKTQPKKEATPAASIPISTTQKGSLPPLATPHTRKMARDMGVDLNKVKGSGPHGRITEEDIKAFAEGGAAPSAPTPLPVAPSELGAAPAGENFEKYGPVERSPLKGVRRKISENMLVAHQQTVMVTHMDEAEVGELIKIRKEKAEFAKRKGVKLTLLPFLMKACTIALKDYPSLNASLSGEEIVFKKYYHFGFAVDTDAGLMVPVIRDVDKKSILHLASELLELSHQARERKISLEDFQGHSFSITNIGSIGGKNFTPIINYPDSAILGLGRTHEKPIIHNGEVVVASVLPLCLTFDHRVTDGATAARFVNQVITYLKDPDLLLLEDGED